MKSALLYLVLVGLPVLGVVGILRLGESIEPPPSVGGVWRVAGGASCAVPEGAFEIEQSGVFLHVLFPGRPAVPARLRAGAFAGAGGARARIAPGCASEPVRIEARTVAAGRLEGRIGTPGCAGCPVARFSAVRDTTASPSLTR